MIQDFILEGTPETPKIELNHLRGDLIFSGISIPENAAKLYKQVLNWVEEYILNPCSDTNLRINLDYYNTASSIWLTKILKALMKINNPDLVLIIHLYLPVEDFDEIDDFDDIIDAFFPVTYIDQNTVPSVGIKVYGTDSRGEIMKEKLVFFEHELDNL